jgi:hypothetical protein
MSSRKLIYEQNVYNWHMREFFLYLSLIEGLSSQQEMQGQLYTFIKLNIWNNYAMFSKNVWKKSGAVKCVSYTIKWLIILGH